jgi:hypothetical protein
VQRHADNAVFMETDWSSWLKLRPLSFNCFVLLVRVLTTSLCLVLTVYSLLKFQLFCFACTEFNTNMGLLCRNQNCKDKIL